MIVLVAYDIKTETNKDISRLNKVKRICSSFGIRRQKSLYECLLTNLEFKELKEALLKVIKDSDSIRFYKIRTVNDIESLGRKDPFEFSNPFII